MPDEEIDFKQEAGKILMAVRFLADLKVEQILRTIQYADAFGPFIDPTAYSDQLYKGDMHALERLCNQLEVPLKFFREQILPKIEAEEQRQEVINNVLS